MRIEAECAWISTSGTVVLPFKSGRLPGADGIRWRPNRYQGQP